MKTLGYSDEEVDTIWKLVAAILHLVGSHDPLWSVAKVTFRKCFIVCVSMDATHIINGHTYIHIHTTYKHTHTHIHTHAYTHTHTGELAVCRRRTRQCDCHRPRPCEYHRWSPGLLSRDPREGPVFQNCGEQTPSCRERAYFGAGQLWPRCLCQGILFST